jgi:hypothetical protein
MDRGRGRWGKALEDAHQKVSKKAMHLKKKGVSNDGGLHLFLVVPILEGYHMQIVFEVQRRNSQKVMVETYKEVMSSPISRADLWLSRLDLSLFISSLPMALH